jgi:3-oxoacyl-ACP reductase-like protein
VNPRTTFGAALSDGYRAKRYELGQDRCLSAEGAELELARRDKYLVISQIRIDDSWNWFIIDRLRPSSPPAVPTMSPDTLSLEGKVAIVTGSGREKGIGAGVVAALTRNGARVIINYVSNSTAPRAAEVVKRIESQGGRVAAVQADISMPEGAAKLVHETLKTFDVDHIDILGK